MDTIFKDIYNAYGPIKLDESSPIASFNAALDNIILHKAAGTP